MVHIPPNGDILESPPPPHRFFGRLFPIQLLQISNGCLCCPGAVVMVTREGSSFGEQAVLRLRAVAGFPGLGSRTWQGDCPRSLSLAMTLWVLGMGLLDCCAPGEESPCVSIISVKDDITDLVRVSLRMSAQGRGYPQRECGMPIMWKA